MAMRSELKWIAAGSALLAAAGFAPFDPGIGEALSYDMAIQTVDPEPVYPEDGAKPGDSGEHAAKATERYRKGQTKPVVRESASSASGSGGGGGPQ
jgi:hypothetical protein